LLAGVPILILALLVALIPSRLEQAGAGASGAWPIRITYSVDQFVFDGANAEHAEFVLEADTWYAWRQVMTCCGEHEGLIVEFRPDGSVWSGGLPGLPLAFGFVKPGDDPMVPSPEFGQRYPASADELAGVPHVTVLFDLAAGIDDRTTEVQRVPELGVAATDLVAYRVDRMVEIDGITVSAVDFRWVYKPLNLTVRVEETLGGSTVRVFKVLTIEFLPSDYTIKFGS
jgi:hypothetical protein